MHVKREMTLPQENALLDVVPTFRPAEEVNCSFDVKKCHNPYSELTGSLGRDREPEKLSAR